jgi:hypothetical protein
MQCISSDVQLTNFKMHFADAGLKLSTSSAVTTTFAPTSTLDPAFTPASPAVGVGDSIGDALLGLHGLADRLLLFGVPKASAAASAAAPESATLSVVAQNVVAQSIKRSRTVSGTHAETPVHARSRTTE